MERRLKAFYCHPEQLVGVFFKPNPPPQLTGRKFYHYALQLVGVGEGWQVQYVGWNDMRACMMVVVYHPDFPIKEPHHLLDEIQLVIVETITDHDGIIIQQSQHDGKNHSRVVPGWRDNPQL